MAICRHLLRSTEQSIRINGTRQIKFQVNLIVSRYTNSKYSTTTSFDVLQTHYVKLSHLFDQSQISSNFIVLYFVVFGKKNVNSTETNVNIRTYY